MRLGCPLKNIVSIEAVKKTVEGVTVKISKKAKKHLMLLSLYSSSLSFPYFLS